MSFPSIQVQMMERARAIASFDSVQMAEIIYGSKAALAAHEAANARICCASGLGSVDNMILPSIYSSTSREEKFVLGLKAGAVTFNDDVKTKDKIFQFKTHDGSLANANPFGLTLFLFAPFIKLQGTDEQIEKWVGMAERGEIIGCYTQSELGHGSFVGGIETTATFDHATDEFIIHSPSLTSTKYWPGALGFTATHSITMARLIIDTKDHGIHAFMMQIRSLADGKPLPGIELGDIGMKMSYNGTDNGYAIFNQVRIPRTNLLMRHAKVSRDGIYSCAPLREKLIYGGMLNGRAIIVRRAAFQFAQTLAIATRYSIVRTQGPIHSSSPTSFPSREAPVITYQHQKDRLLTLISQSYVILFASNVASQTHAKLSAEQATGNHELLPYTHMLFCGLKAWSTQTAADGAEDARKMCGGHGFMAISGLPDIVANAISMCTFEGENFVMWGQVARYLMKAVDMETLPKDMTNNTVIFYGAFPSTTSFSDHSILLEIFKHRAKSLTRTAHALVKDTEARGKSRPEALNIHSTSCLLAGRAHIEVYLLSASISQLSHLKLVEPPTPLAILAVLQDLVSLFALTIIASHHCPFSSSFLSSKSITLSNLTEMRAEIDILLDKLLPDAVALTDAWSFSDASLASALGCKDGDVYNRIMTWTKQLPMNVNANENRGVWEDGWRQIKPFLEMGKARSKL